MLASEVLDDLTGLIADIRESESATATAMLAWIDQTDDASFTVGSFPAGIDELKQLSTLVGNTAQAFFLARALKAIIEGNELPLTYSVLCTTEFGNFELDIVAP